MSAQGPNKSPPRGRRAAAWLGVVGAVSAAGGLIVADPKLLDFLSLWEDGGKTIKVVYADKLAGGLPTACNGLTNFTSRKPVVVGEEWTEEECAAEKNYVVTGSQTRLIECFEIKPPQGVFNAFSSHGHNFGEGTTCESSSMKAWNAGYAETACRLLAFKPDGKPNWSSVKTGKRLPDGRPEMRFVQGLQNRRIAEMQMCLGALK